MRHVVESIEEEYRRYKALAEGAIAQVEDARLSAAPDASGNSIAVLVWHISGNLTSRFTDFLTADGEKPWRQRDEEFTPREVSRAELTAKWEDGWQALFAALGGLSDDHLLQEVTIRGQALPVHTALHRSLAHTASHVGQIVYAAKALKGNAWQWLTIPPAARASTLADVVRLFAYDEWANRRFFDAIGGLTADQFAAPIVSSFPSVRDTLAHIVAVEWLWMRRWKGESPTKTPDWVEQPSFGTLGKRLSEIEMERGGYLRKLDPSKASGTVQFRWLNGEPGASALSDTFVHLVNHSSYHRGQLTMMLRQLGVEPPSTDFSLFAEEGRGA